MLKLGLKKKKNKKGKKSKHKDEELFKPEELEAYRTQQKQQEEQQQQQQQHEQQEESETAATTTSKKAPESNEEWRKFLALTSGVDDVLKKTQGDLDRIKSTSFFQRKLPKSQQPTKEEPKNETKPEPPSRETTKTEEVSNLTAGIVEVSDSDSEKNDNDDDDADHSDDDIFDTGYIDVLTAGDVKLAFIPDDDDDNFGVSNDVNGDGGKDDPFDTSCAESVILSGKNRGVTRKNLYLGDAVEVLTGQKINEQSCVLQRPRRGLNFGIGGDDSDNKINQDFFDSSCSEVKSETVTASKTLLDETPPSDSSIDLTKNIISHHENDILNNNNNSHDNLEDDVDDDDFSALAVESLTKQVTNEINKTIQVSGGHNDDYKEGENTNENWTAAFSDDTNVINDPIHVTNDISDIRAINDTEETTEKDIIDPFDTSFAENIFPGKAELRLIENEILRESEPARKINSDIIIVKNNTDVLLSDTANLKTNLIDGALCDLENCEVPPPLKPTENINNSNQSTSYFDYCIDPFDTSSIKAEINKTDLKNIEKELLDQNSEHQFEENNNHRSLSRPDVLKVTNTKTVSFELPTPDTGDKVVVKPLTPFYVRRTSIVDQNPEIIDQVIIDQEEEEIDPFDTSHAGDVLQPGRAELKQIESELCDTLLDQDFNPRQNIDTKIIDQKIDHIKKINTCTIDESPAVIDLLNVTVDSEEVSAEASLVLRPIVSLSTSCRKSRDHISEYIDPFDTSRVEASIRPGKSEIKLLESELQQATKFEELNCSVVEVVDPFDTSFIT